MQLSLDSTEMPSGCLTVHQVVGKMKERLESDFSGLHVEGEISNFTKARSGHCYFTLKDEESQLSCVMWRSKARRVRIDLEDGMLVRVRGKATIYAARGQLQMQVSSLRLAGEGALQQAFEALKQKLQQEGLFDSSLKKALPPFPDRIGIITSGDGAALHDIISTLQRRYPPVRIQLCSVPVQGDRSASCIVKAIETFGKRSKEQRPDLIILGRGGGSLEDLWSFNEEIVGRAIFDADIPIISAVGHETDFSISDFVADVRAATPTMAAELAVPDGEMLQEAIGKMTGHAGNLVKQHIRKLERRIHALKNSRALHAPVDLLHRKQLQVDELTRRLEGSIQAALTRCTHRTSRIRDQLHSLHPKKPLERGYALVYRNGTHIVRGNLLREGENVKLQFKDATREATITDEDE